MHVGQLKTQRRERLPRGTALSQLAQHTSKRVFRRSSNAQEAPDHRSHASRD